MGISDSMDDMADKARKTANDHQDEIKKAANDLKGKAANIDKDQVRDKLQQGQDAVQDTVNKFKK